MGMVGGGVPVVGLPLALVRYGGTSRVTMSLGIGRWRRVQAAPKRSQARQPGASSRADIAAAPYFHAPAAALAQGRCAGRFGGSAGSASARIQVRSAHFEPVTWALLLAGLSLTGGIERRHAARCT